MTELVLASPPGYDGADSIYSAPAELRHRKYLDGGQPITHGILPPCGAADVGLGALLHVGERVTWPRVRLLQFGDNSPLVPASGAGGNSQGFYRMIWGHQILRLARSMPQLWQLSVGGELGLTEQPTGYAGWRAGPWGTFTG